jgi:hypothetical protein
MTGTQRPGTTGDNTGAVVWRGTTLTFGSSKVPIPKSRGRRSEPPNVIKSCIVCAAPIEEPTTRRRYCGPACQRHAARNRERERSGLPPEAFSSAWTCLCSNCGSRFQQRYSREVYCSPMCSAEAEFVRYFRRVLMRFGAEIPTDVAEALQMRFAHLIGGGYDKRGRRLSKTMREAVWARDRGRCALCSDPGEEIDHIAGSDSALPNLRLLCKPCHREITQSRIRPIDPDDHETLAHRTRILERVRSDRPMRASDSADWQDEWQQWLISHRLPATAEG